MYFQEKFLPYLSLFLYGEAAGEGIENIRRQALTGAKIRLTARQRMSAGFLVKRRKLFMAGPRL